MKRKITVFLPSLGYGGAEVITLRLIKGFIQNGLDVDLVIATPRLKMIHAIHPEVNIIKLGSRKATFSLFKLMRYIRKNKPEIILSHLNRANRIVLLAKYLTRSPVKVFVVEHTTGSVAKSQSTLIHNIFTSFSYRFLYKYAEEIIHVSNGAARDLEDLLGWEPGRIKVVYNPVVDDGSSEKSYSIPHPWFNPEQPPVIVSMGRICAPKDYVTLIKAVDIVRKTREVRLLILGDGRERKKIEDLIQEYGLINNVQIMGIVDDPFPYLFHADLFVLSSTREALPTVIIEALSCGCPVVSTECKYGPSEILNDGIFGKLVPVGNSNAMAIAIIHSLDNIPDRSTLRNRANEFSIQKSTDLYIRILGLKN